MDSASDATWGLLLEHGQFLRALARALVSDETLAADVEQSTWLAAATHPPRDRARVRSWLRRVATNFARQFERGERRRERREAASAVGEAPPPADVAAQEIEAQRLVLDAVRGLESKYRTVIVLRFYDDLGPTAIAERLAAPVATVRTQLQRALALLREQLDRKFEGRRDRWQQALAPLAVEIVRRSSAPALVAVAVATLATVGGAWWSVQRGASPRAAAPRTASAPSASAANAPAPAAPAAAPAQAAAHRERSAALDAFEGRVVDSMGRPIEGVQVDLFEEFHRGPKGATPKQSVRSDEHGRFRLVDVGYGNRDVVASRAGYVTSHALFERGPTGTGLWTRLRIDRLLSTIVLEEARTVHGVVLDYDGRPVATAAVVEFDSNRSEEGVPPEATVDEQGRFELSGVPLDAVEIVAVAPRFGLAQVALPAGRDELTVGMSSTPSCTLDAAVVDGQGKPISDGWIEIKYKSQGSDVLSFLKPPVQLPVSFGIRTLPPDGHLVRTDLPPGECEVRAFVHGPVSVIPAVTAALAPADAKSVVLRVEGEPAYAPLHGVIRSRDGAPIENSTVVALGASPRSPCGRSDASGRFEIAGALAPDGKARLFLDDPDWTLVDASDGQRLVEERADATGAIVLTAARAASLRGRVTTASGARASDVPLELHAVGASARRPLATTLTDSDGRFAFTSLVPRTDPAEIGVEVGSQYVAPPERFELHQGSARADAQIVIPDFASIRGRVADSNGNPRAGVRLILDSDPLRHSAVTNRAGEFRFADLSDGDHALQVEEPGGPSSSGPIERKVTIEGGRSLDGLEFTLEQTLAATGPIRGRIVLQEGTAKPGARVFVEATSDSGDTSEGSESTISANFLFGQLHPGHYRLVAKSIDDDPIGADAPAIARVSKVVDAQTGGPAAIVEFPPSSAAATVLARFTSADGSLSETTIDWDLSTDLSEEEAQSVMGPRARLGNGEFRLLVATPGTYRISFGIEFKTFFTRVITVPARGEVDLGEIPIRKNQLHGVVTDRLGTPLANALVVADSNLEWLMTIDRAAKPDPGTKRVKTDAKGEFSIDLGFSGLCFWKKGFAPRRFEEGEDELPRDNTFVLLPAGDLRLTNFPPDITRSRFSNWVVTLVWKDEESELHGYPRSRGSVFSPSTDAEELFKLPAGHHVLHLWKKSAGSGDDETPPPTSPHISYAWPIEIRAGEVTEIDVGQRW